MTDVWWAAETAGLRQREQVLEACTACFEQKVLCWTLGFGGRRWTMKDKQLAGLEESSESEEYRDGNRLVWLTTP